MQIPHIRKKLPEALQSASNHAIMQLIIANIEECLKEDDDFKGLFDSLNAVPVEEYDDFEKAALEQPPVLTLEQLAEREGIKSVTLRAYIARGQTTNLENHLNEGERLIDVSLEGSKNPTYLVLL